MSKVSWIYAGQRWSSTKKMVYAFYPDTVIAVEGSPGWKSLFLYSFNKAVQKAFIPVIGGCVEVKLDKDPDGVESIMCGSPVFTGACVEGTVVDEWKLLDKVAKKQRQLKGFVRKNEDIGSMQLRSLRIQLLRTPRSQRCILKASILDYLDVW